MADAKALEQKNHGVSLQSLSPQAGVWGGYHLSAGAALGMAVREAG